MTNDILINPPQVRLPASLQSSEDSGFYQSQATVLYQLWYALLHLGTPNSPILPSSDLTESFVVACSDEVTALTIGTQKATFRMPYAFTLTEIRASVTTAPTGTTPLTIDIGVNGISILSTKLTFNSGDKTTVTALIPAVATTASLKDNDEIRIDILGVGNVVAGAGLKVTLAGVKA